MSGALSEIVQLSTLLSLPDEWVSISVSRSFWFFLGGDECPALQFSVPHSAFVDKNRPPSRKGIVHGLLSVRPVRPHSQTLKTQRKFSGGGAYLAQEEASKITMKGVEGKIFLLPPQIPPFPSFPFPFS